MLKRLLLTLITLIAAESAWATTYYIAANGLDTNNGTSTSTPWAHAPGMQNCTSNCAAHAPAPGDRFIFKGGDTWHAGTTPVSLPWTIDSSICSQSMCGTSSNPIYFGVDSTWFNSSVCGASWCRPILNGDNSTSTSTVTSCAHQLPSDNAAFISGGSYTYVTIDNFEFTGMCSDGSYQEQYFNIGYSSTASGHNTYKNWYIHGATWTTSPTTSGSSVLGVNSTTHQYGEGDLWTNLLFDNSDTAATNLGSSGFANMYGTFYEVSFSHVKYGQDGFVGGSYSAHDNLIELTSNGRDTAAHANCWLENASWDASNIFFYNNTFRNNHPIAECVWVAPVGSDTLWFFNNVLYKNDNLPDTAGEPLDYNSGSSGVTGFVNAFNNTYDGGVGANFVAAFGVDNKVTYKNNLWINCTSASACEGGTPVSTAGDVFFSDSTTAADYGYAQSGDYKGTTSDCNGHGTSDAHCPIGKGSNLSSSCSSTPGSALCSDTSDGGTRTPAARPTTGAWDTGAWQH